MALEAIECLKRPINITCPDTLHGFICLSGYIWQSQESKFHPPNNFNQGAVIGIGGAWSMQNAHLLEVCVAGWMRSNRSPSAWKSPNCKWRNDPKWLTLLLPSNAVKDRLRPIRVIRCIVCVTKLTSSGPRAQVLCLSMLWWKLHWPRRHQQAARPAGCGRWRSWW